MIFVILHNYNTIDMKKSLLILVLSVITSIASAQNLQITNHSSTYTYNGSSEKLSHVNIHVKNNSSSSTNIFTHRKIQSLTPGHLSYFCFGVTCYPPSVSKSPDMLTLAAGASDTSIITYLDPLGTVGASIVTYCVKNSQETDSACVTITYDMTATGIVNNSHLKFVKVFPNPAETELNLAYNTEKNFNEMEIQLLDINGRLVYSEKLNSKDGLIKMDVSEFTAGIYVCNLIADGRVLARDKAVIK
jgi:hypothetical protein